MSNNGREPTAMWTSDKVHHALKASPQFADAIANLLNIQPIMAQELNMLRLIAQKVVEAAMLPNSPPAIIVPGRPHETNEQKSLRILGEAARLAGQWASWAEASHIPTMREEPTNEVQDTD